MKKSRTNSPVLTSQTCDLRAPRAPATPRCPARMGAERWRLERAPLWSGRPCALAARKGPVYHLPEACFRCTVTQLSGSYGSETGHVAAVDGRALVGRSDCGRMGAARGYAKAAGSRCEVKKIIGCASSVLLRSVRRNDLLCGRVWLSCTSELR